MGPGLGSTSSLSGGEMGLMPTALAMMAARPGKVEGGVAGFFGGIFAS